MWSNGDSSGLGNGASVCLWDAADPRIRTLPWVFRRQVPFAAVRQ